MVHTYMAICPKLFFMSNTWAWAVHYWFGSSPWIKRISIGPPWSIKSIYIILIGSSSSSSSSKNILTHIPLCIIRALIAHHIMRLHTLQKNATRLIHTKGQKNPCVAYMRANDLHRTITLYKRYLMHRAFNQPDPSH